MNESFDPIRNDFGAPPPDPRGPRRPIKTVVYCVVSLLLFGLAKTYVPPVVHALFVWLAPPAPHVETPYEKSIRELHELEGLPGPTAGE